MKNTNCGRRHEECKENKGKFIVGSRTESGIVRHESWEEIG
jgi:hypothetical protein